MIVDRIVPDLTGAVVFVVEDEFYLAMEIKSEIECIGGTVIGPFSEAEEALLALQGVSPTCAVVDINLGSGPDFAVAEELRSRGVPFAFMTGYDRGTIPDRFESATRIEKPTHYRRLLEIVAGLAAHQAEPAATER